MKRTVLILNGEIKDYQWHTKLVNPDDTVICADGGTYHALKMNIIPDIVVGDFDSLNQAIIEMLQAKGSEICKLNCEKDEMDSEIALNKIIESGSDKLLILGGIGSRIDYTLSNIHLLVPVLKKGIQGWLVNEDLLIYLVSENNPAAVSGNTGDRVSIMPLTSKIHGPRLSGFKYPLIGQTIPIGVSWGMSNIMLGNSATITIEKGIAVVFQELNKTMPNI